MVTSEYLSARQPATAATRVVTNLSLQVRAVFVERALRVHGRSRQPLYLLGAASAVSSARSSTDRASDYGSEGWEFESLRAHPSLIRQSTFPTCENVVAS